MSKFLASPLVTRAVATGSVLAAGAVSAFAVDPTVDYAAAVAGGKTEVITIISVLLLPILGLYAVRLGPSIAMRMFGKAAR